MNHDVEERLKAAIQAKMATVTPGALRPAQPPTDNTNEPLSRLGSRQRWIAPLLAAAAVVAIAGGTTAVVTLADRHSTPATTPPAPTRPAPTPTSPAPTSSTPTTPAPATTSLRVAIPGASAVVLSVPADWHISKTTPARCCSTPPSVCLVGSGKDFDGNAEHCNMVVTFKESTALSPDTPYPYSQQPHCRNWQTVAESDPPIQGRPAEYREFRDACTSTTTEQWTLMTDPQIVFTHPITATSSHDQFQRIVSTAQLAPPTHGSTRVFDDGIIRSVTRQADGYHITLDRVVDNLDGTQTNTNPITYNYLVVVAPIGTPPTVGAEAQIELFEPHPGPTLYEFIGMSASGHFNFKYVGGS